MPSASEQKKTTPEIRRKDAFGAYTLFKSLPPLLLRPVIDEETGVRPTPREYALSIGIDDETTLDLLDLQTQKNFAAKYGIAEQTLVRWNKQLEGHTTLSDMQVWARPLLANVLMRLYAQIMEDNAQPGHYALWLKVVAGWSEKQISNTRVIRTVNLHVVESQLNH